ncbi:hybrid nonribosomal peptide synthetase/polyketide synthase [Paenibacillus sp. FSL R7-269]|uniref:non-ribosomal peptide synthetase n=1 Tax=Paenibacillus sp. FSL R7-269 TaxID=1226755 RepID=UPI0003E20261|nr:non-ribosomal peptide synthetase [Paenibacillus sp. FSL R7-269]ETT37861.1 hybrid nonribosomal peptide synthetase/polyketide synthase [Paenibacillus sp. FSL R7-269]
MDDASIIKKYILEQVKAQSMDSEIALKVLKLLTQKEKKGSNDIAVIGMACKFSDADNTQEYWSNILNSMKCIRDLPHGRKADLDPLMNDAGKEAYFQAGFIEEIDKFDAGFFRISPREAMLMDPKQRLFLETVYHAIEDAGYAGPKIYGSNTGMYVGHDHSGELKISYASFIKDADMIAMTGTYPGILASRTSYIFNLKGPSLVVDTACSSGLVSVHLACNALKNEECSMAIAGGVNLFLLPQQTGMMNEIEAGNGQISIFDKNAGGTMWGEGISALVLKPLDRAVEDGDQIYAVIKGSAINNDGASNGITAPNAEAQTGLIVRAWENAKIDPETIGYIETHGTGTILGDPIEIKGITNAFKKYTTKKQFCGIGSVKPNIGHTVAASGIASLIKAILAIKEGVIPPSINFHEPNPLIHFSNSPVYVSDRAAVWESGAGPRRAGVSSFGFSGTNCHVVLEEAPGQAADAQPGQPVEVLTLSAKNTKSLEKLIENYIHFLDKDLFDLSSLCYTANTGRKHCEYRICLKVKDKAELKRELNKLSDSLHFLNPRRLSPAEERELKNTARQKVEAYTRGGKTEMSILNEICSLYEKGGEVDWESLYEGEQRKKTSVPLYPFLKERHWISMESRRAAEPSVHPITWQNSLEAAAASIQLEGRASSQYSETEISLGQIWGAALGMNPMSITADFYEIGGDSIIAIEIVNTLNTILDLSLQVPDLFEHSNIQRLASYIDCRAESNKDTRGNPEIPRIPEAQYYEVSSSQKRIYILNQLNTLSTSYNIPHFIMIEGELDQERLERSLDLLIQRHEVLRTSFSFADKQLVQVVEDHVHLAIEKYRAEDETELNAITRAFIRPFDLSQAPLVRAGLVELHKGKHLLMLDVQHIIADGASIPLLQKEIIYLYENNPLPELNVQYKDFAKWQNELFKTDYMNKQKKYWINTFSGEIPTLNLPYDYPRDSEQGVQGERLTFKASRDLTQRLSKYCSKEKTTLFMTLLAAFNVFLFKHTGQEDIIVGSPIAGRKHKELEQLIGMFVNTLALRNRPSAQMAFRDFLAGVKEKALQAYEHQDYPFEELVDQLNMGRNLNGTALFNVMFVLQVMDNPAIEVNGMKYAPYPFENKTAKFDLVLQAFPGRDELKFEFTYAAKLFKPGTIARFATRFLQILEHVVSLENILIGEIDMLDGDELRSIRSYSQSGMSAPYNAKTLTEEFEGQAARVPDQLAVSGIDGSLNYRELNERANQLARVLIGNGVCKDRVVGIIAERSTNFAVGIMGILKAGGAYLPIEPAYPPDRKRFMLEDSGACIVLTDKVHRKELEHGIKEVCLEEVEVCSGENGNLEIQASPDSLAYVIYTSGSTGQPKGVMIEHRSVTNLVDALHEKVYSLHGPHLNVALLAPFAFDASVKQIFSALLQGHHLNIVPGGVRQDIIQLTEYYKQHNIDISDGTPAYIRLLSETSLCGRMGVSHFIIGGEALSLTEVERFYNNYGGYSRPYITNVYGPTECCVDATAFTIKPEELRELQTLPIGSPIKNCSVYILDEQKRLVPTGVLGELYIGGQGVGRGYSNNKELTDIRFVEDFCTPGRYMYKTGDIGRWMEDGQIYFAGRADDQVKIRGFRIELDEIRHRLLSCDGVQQAVVAVKKDQREEPYLCAYVVCRDGQILPELNQYLKDYLPDYMIPQAIIPIDQIPVTVNGKVDTSRLPDLQETRDYAEGYAAPRNYVEEILCTVWSEVLELRRIGINDNFFGSGGDSIKAIQAAARMEKYNLRLEAKYLFQYQTISEVSKKVQDRADPAEYGAVTGEAALVPIQSWMIEHCKDTLHHRNLSFVLYREAGFGEEYIKKSFTELIKHHDALRMVFKDHNRHKLQYNRGSEEELFDFYRIDLAESHSSIEDAKAAVNQVQASMDLEKGPLVKLALIKAKDGEHLLIVVHQMIIDHLSWRIVLEDLDTVYRQLINQEDIRLPPKTASFLQWSNQLHEYAHSTDLLCEKPYWNQVESVEVTPLPTDYETDEARVKDNFTLYQAFDFTETEQIMSSIRGNRKFTTESVMLTALAMTICDWTGNLEVVVNLGNHGRDLNSKDIDILRTVGRFSTLYPVALQLPEDRNIGSCLEYVREYLGGIPKQGGGHGVLKYLSSPQEGLQFRLNPELSFNYMGQFDAEFNTDIFRISPITGGEERSGEEVWNYKLKFISFIKMNQLTVGIEYNHQQYTRETVHALLQQYMVYLQKAAAKPLITTNGGLYND